MCTARGQLPTLHGREGTGRNFRHRCCRCIREGRSSSKPKCCRCPKLNASGKACRAHWIENSCRSPTRTARISQGTHDRVSVGYTPQCSCTTDFPMSTELDKDKRSNPLTPLVPNSSRPRTTGMDCFLLVCICQVHKMSTVQATPENIHLRTCNSTATLRPCWHLRKSVQGIWSRALIR